ncbi:beta-L-arabinofuranosidase domain-containing protein [Sedimentisphaera salicampi]|uniref:F5/8 type C domain-containing protein n=1 Tax=Sedimentisphaera salicampi TaxID=1941349 RepID=A0A1W6LK88_9BACT|nr:beta-L-arabinofuranosidase domain-containing protein [Sedimentisphaera salicampi]ARN56166.1 hypothetical protein STSP1_00539 [Sedimentisphaera salicampi]
MEKYLIAALVLAAVGVSSADVIDPVPFYEVKIQDTFWQPKLETLAESTLPHALGNTEKAVKRLRLTAEWREADKKDGMPLPIPHRYITSDLVKVMEGAALLLKVKPNPKMEKEMDRIIDIIARAQREDGYLYVTHQTKNYSKHWKPETNYDMMGKRPYDFLVHSHELYNMGHLYEAAVAYYQATWKDNFLKIAEKSAKHINKVIFEGDPNYNDGEPVMQAPGHEEIELGLVKLYRVTGNKLYIEMAKKFLKIRGVTYQPEYDGRGVMLPRYAQQHKPVAEQRRAEGHSVRAGYLYAAMAEVDSVLGENDYSKALNSIWHNIVDTRFYIIGGLGSGAGMEGFGPEYYLPNRSAYNETCAAVANVFFNYRMFLKYGDAKYIDAAETSLYNNCLGGVSLDGKTFYYSNVLETDLYNKKARSEWFGTACCPANISRLIPQVGKYLYAKQKNDIYCLMYAGSKTSIELKDGQKVELKQITEYPFKGNIKIKVSPKDEKKAFAVNVRIPTWTGQQFTPGELYDYTSKSTGYTLKVNGKKINGKSYSTKKGFARINRKWKKGDKIELSMPMPVRINKTIDKVEANHDRFAVTRGPLVYCAEEPDNGYIQQYFIDKQPAGSDVTIEEMDGVLSGIPSITIPAKKALPDDVKSSSLKLIPYYARSNRKIGTMTVWVPEKKELTKPNYEALGLKKYANIRASIHENDKGNNSTKGLYKWLDPENSHERLPRWSSWGDWGKEHWVELDLGKVKEIENVAPYFYDTGKDKWIVVPKKWHVETRKSKDDKWVKMVPYNTDSYTTQLDTYNTVQPDKELKARYIKIVMTPKRKDLGVGLLSVNVGTKED